MMNNIVFDLGNVLIKYDPEYFLQGYSEAEKALFRTEIYDSEYWRRLDRGEVDEEELIEQISSRIPKQYCDDVRKLVRWYTLSAPMEGMEQLVLQLKERGYPIYLLSNTSRAFYTFGRQIPALKHFTGLFISADHGVLKPDKQIFHLFCEEFSLRAAECVFIDDTPANVKSANEVGFTGVLFTGDVAELQRELVNIGVLENENRK